MYDEFHTTIWFKLIIHNDVECLIRDIVIMLARESYVEFELF